MMSGASCPCYNTTEEAWGAGCFAALELAESRLQRISTFMEQRSKAIPGWLYNSIHAICNEGRGT